MALPRITLGGIPIVIHAGAPDLSVEPLGGRTVLRMSDGAAVLMTHWQRESGSISGEGWMPPGLDGLDYTQPLELRSTQVRSIVGAGLEHDLPSRPRPDVAPWGEALVGEQWVVTGCAYTPGTESAPPHVALAPVAGATLYRACWMPVYSVIAQRPTSGQASGQGTHSWTLNWEEA